jgi:hypothetical protein
MSGSRWEVGASWMMMAILAVVFGGGLVTGQTVVAFRDSGYLYYPLLEWLDQFGLTGFPLWNPYCNLGHPLVGDGSSGVLYPLRVLLFLPGCSFPARYGIFLVLHLMLAALNAYWLARQLGTDRAGGTLAGMSYALGGAVLTQMSNLIYLISAAWLPLAVGGVWLMIHRESCRWTVVTAVVCALMILGGDPQMTYQVGLIAAATLAVRRVSQTGHWLAAGRSKAGDGSVQDKNSLSPKFFGWQSEFAKLGGDFGRLILLVLVTAGLAAAQIVSTWDWAWSSERQVARFPEDRLPESGELVEPGTVNPWLESRRLDRDFQAYQFSLPPWTLAELFWPNFSGKLYPVYQRWSDALPGADRIWYPSIYFGLIPLWLALGQIRLGEKSSRAWLSWVALWFCLGSFGWYGLGWFLREVLPPGGWSLLGINRWAPQVGGVYWMMDRGLPLFDLFRYPAKLFLVTSLCLSVLAGLGLTSGTRFLSSRGLVIFLLISLIGWGSVTGGYWEIFLRSVPPDQWLGRFDWEACQRNLSGAFLTGMGSLVAAFGLQWVVLRAKNLQAKNLPRGNEVPGFKHWPEVGSWLLLLLTAVDLSFANRWLLAEVPSSIFSSKPEIARAIAANFAQTSPASPLAVFRSRDAGDHPEHWRTSSSPDRLAEIAIWQRKALFPKHHLASSDPPVRVIGSFSSLEPAGWATVLNGLESEKETGQLALDFSLGRNRLARWANLRIRSDPDATGVVMEWIDRQQKMVSFEVPITGDPDSEPTQEEAVVPFNLSLVSFAAERIEIFLSATRPGRLIHHSTWDGNWYAIIRPVESALPEIRKGLSPIGIGGQGLDLAAGDYRIELVYQPRYFQPSIGLMGLSWLAVSGWWLWLKIFPKN